MVSMSLAGILTAAFIPMALALVWYSPWLFGRTWLRVSGLEAGTRPNPLTMFLMLLFGGMVSIILISLTIHQISVLSTLAGDESEEAKRFITDFMAKYGNNYRTMGHGALHGGITAVFFVLPIFGFLAILERRSWAYVGVHFGFWLLSLMLMGAFVCAP